MSRDKTYKKLVGSKRWATLAKKLKVRALGRCQRCGTKTYRLAVHHIVPVETGRNEREMASLCFNIGNCQVLCYRCHAEIHKAERVTLPSVMREREAARVNRFIKATLETGEQTGGLSDPGPDFFGGGQILGNPLPAFSLDSELLESGFSGMSQTPNADERTVDEELNAL